MRFVRRVVCAANSKSGLSACRRLMSASSGASSRNLLLANQPASRYAECHWKERNAHQRGCNEDRRAEAAAKPVRKHEQRAAKNVDQIRPEHITPTG